MAPLWPLTFSSGEWPRALWAILFCWEGVFAVNIWNYIVIIILLDTFDVHFLGHFDFLVFSHEFIPWTEEKFYV